MAFLTDYQYYYNGGVDPQDVNHGSYQYISLEDIVKNFKLMYTGNNSLIRNEPRHKIIHFAKLAIRELNYDALKEIKVMQLEVNDDLKVVLPHDFVSWVRISEYRNGSLIPMYEDDKTNWGRAYLTDNSKRILFDNDGNVIFQNNSLMEDDRKTGNDNNGYLKTEVSAGEVRDYNEIVVGGRYGLDASKATSAPTFVVNKAEGTLEISSNGSGKTIYIEYVSDGMERGVDSSISVNKLFEQYIYAEIAYQILDSKIGVQEYVIRRYKRKRKALWQNARIRINKMNPGNLLMPLRAQQNWIK